jgi:hypothetical protein
MVTVPAVLLASAQELRVIRTVWTVVVPVVAVQAPVNPDAYVTVGVAGTVKLELNVTEMVLVAARVPVAEVVKPTLQVEVAPAAVEPGVKVTPVGEVGVITTSLVGWPMRSVEVATPKVAAV